MNILVPLSWLKDFLKTDASAEKIAQTMSLCSQSVEKIHKFKNDEILEIEITVNRYDCLSIIGIARESAAILPQFKIKSKLILPKIKPILKISNKKQKKYLEVIIKDQSVCPRFSAILLEDVKVGPSPPWMVDRLKKVNIRSINNVVDISNYLMIETGQPIHTFDFDKILGHKMIMRLSRPGESVKTLDGIERILPGGDIVIEDGSGRLIDLCGIMGGENSQIDDKTKRVLFFVQAYDPTRIRKTSMSIGLRTEAASRFERGIDLEGIIDVIARGVEMMEKLTNAKIGGELIDIYPQKQISPKIKVCFQSIKEKLGIDIDRKQIIKILESLGFKIKIIEKDLFEISVPSWRAKDIIITEDIIEEIARIYGYFKFPSKIPNFGDNFNLLKQPLPKKGNIGHVFKWEEKAKDILKGLGFSETYNFSFIGREIIKKNCLSLKDHLRISNPLTSNFEYLRISLIPSLLEVFKNNISNFPKIDIFEMANIYQRKDNDLPDEKMKLSILTNSKNFFELKGVIIAIFNELGIYSVNFEPEKNLSKEPLWEKDYSAIIYSKNQELLGIIGMISKKVIANYNLSSEIFCADLDFEILKNIASEVKIFSPLSKYPPIIEDLSFIFQGKTYIGKVIKEIKKINSLIKSVDLIDSFEETKTFRITYQSCQKNLDSQEIKRIRENIIKMVGKNWGGKIKIN